MARPADGSRPRPTCESHVSIDVRRWHREGRLRPDQYSLCSWQCRGEPSGEMIVLTECDNVILVYKSLGLGASKAEPILQQVAITWTGLHFGGRRPWFICGCGRRAAVLYTIGGLFRCRRCQGLVYASQQESPCYRNLSQAQKVRLRLGGDPVAAISRLIRWTVPTPGPCALGRRKCRCQPAQPPLA
jgi:hypothetical protein